MRNTQVLLSGFRILFQNRTFQADSKFHCTSSEHEHSDFLFEWRGEHPSLV